MSVATEKDELLRRINSAEIDLNFDDYEFIMGDQKEFGDLFRRYQNELFLKGYIRKLSEVEEAFYVRLTPEGQLFLGNGGYTLIEQKEQSKEIRRKKEWRWKLVYESITLIVAAFAAIISLIALFSKDDQIKELELRVDLLGQKLKRIEQSQTKLKRSSENKVNVKISRPTPH